VGEWFLERQTRLSLELLEPVSGGTVLDVGGGHGQLAGPLAGAGFDVVVLGSRAACAERIADLVEAGRARFREAPLLPLPWPDDAFDVVIAFRLLPHVEDWRGLVAEMARVARRAVVFDYPTRRSVNAVSGLLYGLKRGVEGNTRPFTVFGEGVRGSCSKTIIEKLGLQGKNDQTYETGIKEIWRVKPEKHKPGRVIHGSLWPDLFGQMEGMWLYDMKDNLVSFGYVTPLNSENPANDPHMNAQRFKTVPFMQDLLEGAELVRYGAKCVPSGGLNAIPKLYCNGAMLVGDSAGMLNIMKLAGVHTAIKSGMLAAETIVDAMARQDFDAARRADLDRAHQDAAAVTAGSAAGARSGTSRRPCRGPGRESG